MEAEFVNKYKTIRGGLTWLYISTRPDLGVAIKLLSSHNHRPGSGHMDSARTVLKYLKGSASRGIRFTSIGYDQKLTSYFRYPEADVDTTTSYCDANWGPQDASHPIEGLEEMITVEECRSLQGCICVRMGGAVAWRIARELRVSRSTCESEIRATDDCCKLTQGLRLLLTDLRLSDVLAPTKLLNDNRGTVDWSNGWANRLMRHINIRGMAVRDAREHKEITVEHIDGKRNPADLLTKEHKAGETFTYLCEVVVPLRDDGGCWQNTTNPSTGQTTDVPVI